MESYVCNYNAFVGFDHGGDHLRVVDLKGSLDVWSILGELFVVRVFHNMLFVLIGK